MGNFVKVNPPLRSEEDRNSLLEGIKDGTIDMVATDHAPHTKDEKEKDYKNVPAGVPGIEVSLPLMLLEVKSGEIDIKKVAGGILIQHADTRKVSRKDLKVMSKKKPTQKQIEDMLFARNVVKHVKSNSVVFVILKCSTKKR
jgi:dihydroorotase-like cyclic amidohydrolase